MDVQLTETQRLMSSSAADWLRRRWPAAAASRYFEDRVLDNGLWREVASFGWLGLGCPGELGGSGGSLSDVVVLQEQLGAALFPTIVGSSLSVTRILSRCPGLTGTAAEVGGCLASGDLRATAAVQERSSGFLSPPRTSLAGTGGNWMLRGEKWFVRDADQANWFAVLALRDSDSDCAWVLVESSTDGVTTSAQEGSANDGQAIVRFDDVRIPSDCVVDVPAAGIAEGLATLMLMEAARLAGIGSRALRMAIQHATTRVQFGRPIGSFQAIQHKVADMTTDVESSSLATHFAAFNIEHTDEGFMYAMTAKLWASEAVQRVVRESHQIHGGIGYTLEMPLHLYFRHAATGALLFGSPNELTARIADQLLPTDLPGPQS